MHTHSLPTRRKEDRNKGYLPLCLDKSLLTQSINSLLPPRQTSQILQGLGVRNVISLSLTRLPSCQLSRRSPLVDLQRDTNPRRRKDAASRLVAAIVAAAVAVIDYSLYRKVPSFPRPGPSACPSLPNITKTTSLSAPVVNAHNVMGHGYHGPAFTAWDVAEYLSLSVQATPDSHTSLVNMKMQFKVLVSTRHTRWNPTSYLTLRAALRPSVFKNGRLDSSCWFDLRGRRISKFICVFFFFSP